MDVYMESATTGTECGECTICCVYQASVVDVSYHHFDTVYRYRV